MVFYDCKQTRENKVIVRGWLSTANFAKSIEGLKTEGLCCTLVNGITKKETIQTKKNVRKTIKKSLTLFMLDIRIKVNSCCQQQNWSTKEIKTGSAMHKISIIL